MSLDTIPPYTCMEVENCAYQLAQKYLQKQVERSRPRNMDDRPKRVPISQHLWPMARKQGRWHKALADGLRGWPTSHPFPSEAKPQVLGPQPSTKTNKLRDPKARRATETFGNSKRTRAWMIIECSNDDVQVLKTVKNGVSIVAPL